MKKYHVYNTVRYVRNMFGGANAAAAGNKFGESDMKLLAAMCMSAKLRTSRLGNRYWYYVTNNEQDNALATYLLLRNGVNVMPHKTHLFNPARPVLRAPGRLLNHGGAVQNFMNQVSHFAELYTTRDMESYKAHVLHEMTNGKTL